MLLLPGVRPSPLVCPTLGHPGDGGKGPAALTTASLWLMTLLLTLLPALTEAVFFRQQNISNTLVSYCGFFSIERYKTWCESPINVFVASNSSCQVYGVCVPLDDADGMTCRGGKYCSGWRQGGSGAACLALRSADEAAVAVCDVEIQGPSLYDMSPHPHLPPPPSSLEPSEGHHDWALWKTMAIIWSVVGFAALMVITVLLIRCLLRWRTSAATHSPITILSPFEKKRIEEAQAGLHQGSADATIILRPTVRDGKPILAYGSSYLPPPLLMQVVTANDSARLQPTAGDAILQASANSCAAYNGPPFGTAPVVSASTTGAALPLAPLSYLPDAAAATAIATATATPITAAEVVTASVTVAAVAAMEAAASGVPPPPSPFGSSPAHGGVEWLLGLDSAEPGAGAPATAGGSPAVVAAASLPVVTPAALMPPAAATLRNPTGSG